jgi:hypothetical protein
MDWNFLFLIFGYVFRPCIKIWRFFFFFIIMVIKNLKNHLILTLFFFQSHFLQNFIKKDVTNWLLIKEQILKKSLNVKGKIIICKQQHYTSNWRPFSLGKTKVVCKLATRDFNFLHLIYWHQNWNPTFGRVSTHATLPNTKKNALKPKKRKNIGQGPIWRTYFGTFWYTCI